MNSISLSPSIRILYLPPYYETHFQLALDRLITSDKHLQYQVFTIDQKFVTTDWNSLLSLSRRIIHDEHIQMIIADSHLGQLIKAKLCEEYPQICNKGMNLLNTLKCINRFLMRDLFGIEECIPTLVIDIMKDWKTNFRSIEKFFMNQKMDGYVKSVYGFDNQAAGFRFLNGDNYIEMIEPYIELYREQHLINLLPLFRVYISKKQYPLIFEANYLLQPFFDLVTYPHWRLVIANACIFDKEIIMWPLVDGYSGWPFLADKPLAIIPILICPSRQISSDQQTIIYTRFRKHLTHLITNSHLHYGWIECSYLISCTNDIRLVSIKPTYSVYLTEAFSSTNQYGNPIMAFVQLSNRQRPQTPILNGKTVYIHRLWTNIEETCSINDLIDMKEIKRIHRSNICINRYVRLRFREDDILHYDKKQRLIEIGFIQVAGEYYEIGLTNLIEFRYNLLKKPEFFPFIHPSLLPNHQYQFDSITCLPSHELLDQLEQIRQTAHKDLI